MAHRPRRPKGFSPQRTPGDAKARFTTACPELAEGEARRVAAALEHSTYAVCRFWPFAKRRPPRQMGGLAPTRPFRLTEEAMTVTDFLLELFYLVDTELEALKSESA